MINLLRMDLYRLWRSKYIYVGLGLLFASTILVYLMIWLSATPGGQAVAVDIGMYTSDDLLYVSQMFAGEDIMTVFRQTALNGGLYSTMVGIIIALFVITDFTSGYMKNIVSLHRGRIDYICSKIITAGVLNLLYLIVSFGFNLLIGLRFRSVLPCPDAKDMIFYLVWAWALTTALCALIILACVLTRNIAAGVLAAVLFGGGVIVLLLARLTEMFHASAWVNYTIYINLSYGPTYYEKIADMRVLVIGLVYLLVYGILSCIVLKNQDI